MSKRNPVGLLVAVCLCLIACTDENSSLDEENGSSDSTETEAVELPETQDFMLSDCQTDIPRAVTATCGTLSVPQDWDDPSNGETAELAVIVMIEDETPRDATPVVYLDGGPGGNTLSDLTLAYSQLFDDITEERPMVLYSQRGSRLSNPDLECEEVTEYQLESIGDLASTESKELEASVLFDECVERLKGEGIDLSEFGSENAAQDLEALKQALGYEKWSIYSLSYGTRLAQTYARLYPESIEGLVLDSVMPTDPQAAIGNLADNADRSFRLLFDSCEADFECANNYPNLESRFYALYDELQAEPISFQSVDLSNLSLLEVVWDGDAMLANSFSALYAQEAFTLLPSMIAEMESGSYLTAGILASVQVSSIEGTTIGMNSAILCHDAIRHLDQETYLSADTDNQALLDQFFVSEEGFQEQIESCDLFGQAKASDADIKLVESDVPTLVTAGSFDPITPPSNSQLVAAGFSNSTYFEFPTLGHGVVNNSCANQIIRDFYADPTGQLDGSCIAEIPPLTWQ